MANKNTFSIGDTAEMAGVSQRQIRDWEARGYIPKAQRLICGDRAYPAKFIKSNGKISLIVLHINCLD